MSNLNNNTTQLEALLAKVNALPEAGGGIELPELTNEASSTDLLVNKQLINQDGNIIEGSMPNNGAISETMDGINIKSITIPTGYTSGGSISLDDTIDNEVTEQTDLITQIKNTVDNLPEAGSGGGSGGVSIETCTIHVSAESSYSGGGYIAVTQLIDENIVPNVYAWFVGTPVTIENVVCGSVITCRDIGGIVSSTELSDNMTFIEYDDFPLMEPQVFVAITAPAVSNAVGEIIFS